MFSPLFFSCQPSSYYTDFIWYKESSLVIMKWLVFQLYADMFVERIGCQGMMFTIPVIWLSLLSCLWLCYCVLNALDGKAHLKEIMKWDGINGFTTAMKKQWTEENKTEEQKEERAKQCNITVQCITIHSKQCHKILSVLLRRLSNLKNKQTKNSLKASDKD